MEPDEVIAEPAAVLALAEAVCPSLNGASSYRLSTALELIDSGIGLDGDPHLEAIAETIEQLTPQSVEGWTSRLSSVNARVVTVVDDDYPANLRMVHDHPPFLFVRGTLSANDDRAIAVVGTRQPSDDGLRAAGQLAGELARRDITVVSGMAAGIDTAAHAGAMNAGGRTLAVFGTGIERCYPASNRSLSQAIASSGATLSQFWPDMTATRWSFPVRNIVTSGLSLGTVVVEAGPTSGARLQAEHALRHGKRLYLLQRLVADQKWAQDLMGTAGVLAIDDLSQILTTIEFELDLQTDVLV